MKNIIFFLLALLVNFGCSKSNIFYINPQVLLRDYRGAEKRQKRLITMAKVWQANSDSLVAEMQEQKELSLQAKDQQLLQYRQAIQQKIQAEEARINQEILTEVNAYIKQYGKEKGCDFILGATDNGNIVYAAEGKDITQEVLAGLNQQYDQRHGIQK